MILRALPACLLVLATALAGGCGSDGSSSVGSAGGASAKAGSSCGRADGGEPYTVGFIYNAPVGQGGYVSQHELAREAVDDLPNVETVVVANVPDTDVQPAIDQLIGKGAKTIIGITVGYADAFQRSAQQHADVCFVHTRPGATAPNVSSYSFADWEPAYVLGVVAGKMTQKGKIGFVGSLPIPPIVRDANAYLMGAHSVKPDASLDVVFTNAFFDPPKAKQAAESLIDDGAEVLAAGYVNDTSVVQEAAAHPGVLASGMFSDQQRYGEDAYIGSIVFDLAPHFTDIVEQAMDGAFKSEDFLGRLENGALMVPLGSAVPKDVRAFAAKQIDDLKSGKLKPFVGPLEDQEGQVRIPDGHELTLDELVNWNWFVRGVNGTLPSG